MRSIRDVIEEVYKAGVEGGASSYVEPAIKELELRQGRIVIWKDGTWAYFQDSITWEFEADKEYLLTIDLSKEKTFVDYKDYPITKRRGV